MTLALLCLICLLLASLVLSLSCGVLLLFGLICLLLARFVLRLTGCVLLLFGLVGLLLLRPRLIGLLLLLTRFVLRLTGRVLLLFGLVSLLLLCPRLIGLLLLLTRFVLSLACCVLLLLGLVGLLLLRPRLVNLLLLRPRLITPLLRIVAPAHRWRRAVKAACPPVIESLCRLFAARAFCIPVCLILGCMRRVIGAPGILLVLLRLPLGAFIRQRSLLRRPIGGIDGPPLALRRCIIKRRGPRQNAPRIVVAPIQILVRQQPAILVIHRHQFAIGKAIGILRIAHQVRLIGARLVIIIAIAARNRLRQPCRAVGAAPHIRMGSW